MLIDVQRMKRLFVRGTPARRQASFVFDVSARLLALVIVTAWSGCSEPSTPAPDAPAQVQQARPTTVAPVASPAATTPSASPDEPKSKTRWVGDIPYDVFYDQPLAVAADATSTGTVAVAPGPEMSATEASPETEATATSSPAASDGPDWGRLISADVLNDAVTKLRNSLTTNLNTLATYNRNLESIAIDGACLAALAGVASVHPDAVSWQDNAKYVRDLGNQISVNADGTGRGPFDATKLPFEQIVAMLNGGPPPDMEPEKIVPFADVADRSVLMNRIKKSFDYLRTDVTTEGRFKELRDDVVREASVLASFGGVLSTESYDSADEENYRRFIHDFMQADVDVVAATKADNFSDFEAARSRIQKACNDCHAEYAFGDEGF